MKKPAFTYSQIHGVIAGIAFALKLVVAVAAFFGFWWALWIFQPLLGVSM